MMAKHFCKKEQKSSSLILNLVVQGTLMLQVSIRPNPVLEL